VGQWALFALWLWVGRHFSSRAGISCWGWPAEPGRRSPVADGDGLEAVSPRRVSAGLGAHDRLLAIFQELSAGFAAGSADRGVTRATKTTAARRGRSGAECGDGMPGPSKAGAVDRQTMVRGQARMAVVELGGGRLDGRLRQIPGEEGRTDYGRCRRGTGNERRRSSADRHHEDRRPGMIRADARSQPAVRSRSVPHGLSAVNARRPGS
jgi:hypothetical protein